MEFGDAEVIKDIGLSSDNVSDTVVLMIVTSWMTLEFVYSLISHGTFSFC